MASEVRELYKSPNGDRWLLVRELCRSRARPREGRTDVDAEARAAGRGFSRATGVTLPCRYESVNEAPSRANDCVTRPPGRGEMVTHGPVWRAFGQDADRAGAP